MESKEKQRVRETERREGKRGEAAQYDPDRFDCRLYPVIPLEHGNMCWTCVCVCVCEPLRSLHNQEDRKRERE